VKKNRYKFLRDEKRFVAPKMISLHENANAQLCSPVAAPVNIKKRKNGTEVEPIQL
jgi:hypothetical protein